MSYTKLFVAGAAAAFMTASGFAADAAKPAAKAPAKPAAAPAAPAAQAAPADPFSMLPPVVAEVNGKKVTRQEFADFMKKILAGRQIPPEVMKFQGHDMVRNYVVMLLVEQAMAKAKFTMSQKEVEKAYADSMPPEYKKALDAHLRQQNKTLQQFISEQVANPEIRKGLVLKTFINNQVLNVPKPTEAEARQFYEKNKEQFALPADAPDTLRASHILIAIGKDSDGKAELKQANEILAQLKKNPADFGKIAAEKSACPSGKRAQGSVGAFPKGQGQMVPEFEKAVIALKPGEISQPVKTQFGWHIIRRDAPRKREIPPFDTIKAELIEMLAMEKNQGLLEKYMENLEKAAKVKILVPAPAPNTMVPGAR